MRREEQAGKGDPWTSSQRRRRKPDPDLQLGIRTTPGAPHRKGGFTSGGGAESSVPLACSVPLERPPSLKRVLFSALPTAGSRPSAGMPTGAQPGVRRHHAVRMTLLPSGEGGSSSGETLLVGQGAGGTAVEGATEPAATGGEKRANAPNVTRQERRVTGLTRLEFSRAVLQRAMGFVPGDLNCLVKVPGNADIFEISFKNANVLERFWNLFREGKDKTPRSNFDVEPLPDTENKVVTVQFYNEAVQDHDVSTWLGRYGLVKSDSRRVLDEDGVWTGARK